MRTVAGLFAAVTALGTVFGFGYAASEAFHRDDNESIRTLRTKYDEAKKLREAAEGERDGLKAQLAAHAEKSAEQSIAGYLRKIAADRAGAWGGKFEQLYAPCTLFMLRERRSKCELMGVYGQIIRWRLGAENLLPEDRALLSLTGFAYQADPLGDRSPSEYVDEQVDRVLCDNDLLTVPLDVPDVQQGFKGELVLGEPASGKSTLLKYVEMHAARKALSDDVSPLPVRIELGKLPASDYDSLDAAIGGVLPNWKEEPSADRLMARHYLLLIDALDEAKDLRMASQACVRLAQDPRVDRIIVTCRIINYDMLLRDELDSDPAMNGFRTLLVYGQSLAAVEKRVMAMQNRQQRQPLLEILSDVQRRPVWLQFFRLPQHFEFATDFLLDAKLDELSTPNRTQLLDTYLATKMRTTEWAGPRDPGSVNDLLAAVAGLVFPNRQFGDLQVRLALKAERNLSPERRALVDKYLDFARKIGLIERIPDGYAFRHNQFLEYYTAMNSAGINNTRWSEIEVTDVAFREVLLFRVGWAEGKDVLQRIVDRAEAAAGTPGNERLAQYMIPFALQCIDSSPFKDEPIFAARRDRLMAGPGTGVN